MSYNAEISRSNPTCFILVLDQSGSMVDTMASGIQKADFLADVVNRTLYELIVRCTKPEEVRNYYYISIIGYGNGVDSAFGGTLAGRDLVPISEVADNPVRVETRTKKVPDGAGGIVEQEVKFPVWIDARAENGTPMCEALTKVDEIIDQWISNRQYINSFPPIVLHITDGESTDGDPSEIARRIQSKSVNDGSVLFFNCHLSSGNATEIAYPINSEGLPNEYAATLFNISSILPNNFIETAKQLELKVQNNSRGFVFNADAASLVQFFDIGTRPANLR